MDKNCLDIIYKNNDTTTEITFSHGCNDLETEFSENLVLWFYMRDTEGVIQLTKSFAVPSSGENSVTIDFLLNETNKTDLIAGDEYNFEFSTVGVTSKEKSDPIFEGVSMIDIMVSTQPSST